jgi:M6 family metalloprotease-like protein
MLSGCGLLFGPSQSDNDISGGNAIEGFEFVTDERLVYKDTSESAYYSLTLYTGESYQVKTTVDDMLGENYYLLYTTKDEIEGKFTMSETGNIVTAQSLEQNDVFIINVELYKEGSSKRIAKETLFLSVMTGEHAEITLTNDNLEYDDNTATYSLTMPSGSSFIISYTVSYNTPYVITYSLTDESYSEFMSVDNAGKITTSKTGVDKTGEISIKTTGAKGILDVVFLKITLTKSEDTATGLEVYSLNSGEKLADGATLTVYKNIPFGFDVKYDGETVNGTISASDSNIIESEAGTSSIKGIKVGASTLTFSYGDAEITITVNVIADKVSSLGAGNTDADFIIIYDTLYYLNYVILEYDSGTQKNADTAQLVANITNLDGQYKTVTLSYVEGGTEVVASFRVKYYTAEAYDGMSVVYDNNDYFNNRTSEYTVLSREGTVKLLVIPVWFNDSDVFFNESQKEQIVEDIEYTMSCNRPSTEFFSLKQYYEKQSFGSITMDITVSDFYNSNTSYQNYSDYVESKIYNTYTLCDNAVNWYFENNTDESFDDYDLNGDGYVDGVILYYGANYYGAQGDQNKSVAYATYASATSERAYNTLAFCPIGGLYGLSKKEPTTQLETQDLSATFARAFRESARTIIHEVGHMFGNEDLYEDQFAGERYSPAGSFVMQDRNFGSHDPYHTNKIGWSKPMVYASSDYQLGDKITIHISDFQSTGQNVILTNNWNDVNSLYDEYLILELFAPVGLNGYDSEISFLGKLNSGIRLWHVNSLLSDLTDGGNTTYKIVNGHQYELAYSNNDVTSEYDMLHLIRNNTEEAYNTNSAQQTHDILFKAGDSFDMASFHSQFINGETLDNGDKLGWNFKVENIYVDSDGNYGAIITLERVDNVKTKFTERVVLNRSDLETPDGEEEYGEKIFGADGVFSFTYKYVTPPSVYEQNYPISTKGMCLFAAENGDGGYIDLTIQNIDGKTVRIDSISITYSKLTNAAPTVLVDGEAKAGVAFTPEDSNLYGYEYEVGAQTVRIQNRYDGTINHWSVLPLYEITINYTIE